MKDNEMEFPEDERIDREASPWVAKRVKGFTAKEQDAFFEWLADDSRHSEWYTRHMKSWNQLDQLAQWKPEHSQRPNQDLLKYQMTRSRWAWLGGLAAALVVVGSAWFLSSDRIAEEVDKVSRNLVANDYESHVLPDGSIVEMNRGAALKVDYTEEARRVELVSSEAHFEVAKDPNRPFIVHALGVDIRAVGTAFNVKLTGDTVELLVTEGRVQMVTPEPFISEGSSGLSKRIHDLVAGQMSVASLTADSPSIDSGARESNAEVVEVSAAEVGDLLAWKPELLEFDDAPLSEVVEEFNNRNTVQMEFADAELGDEPIVASFYTANVDHFVELLEWTFGIQSERVGEERVVLRKP